MAGFGETVPSGVSEAQAALEAELTLAEDADGLPIAPIAPSAEPAPAIVPPKAAEPAPIAPNKEPAPEEGEEDPHELPGPTKSKQIRLSGEDFHFASLLKGEVKAGKITRDEAYARAYGVAAPAIARSDAQIDDGEADDTPPTGLAAQEARLEEVRQALRTISRDEPLYTEEIEALQEERANLVADIRVAKEFQKVRDAEAAAVQAEREGQSFDQAWDASLAAVEADYGDIAKPDGVLGTAIANHILAIAEDPTHRFHSVAREGKLMPEDVAATVAKQLNAAPQPNSQKPAGAPAVTKVPTMLPAPGAARTTPVVPVNQAQKQAQFASSLASAKTADEKLRILEAELGGEEGVTDGRFAMA